MQLTFMSVALFSSDGDIMTDPSEALVEQVMAIAMPSDLHVPAVARQEYAVDCRLFAKK